MATTSVQVSGVVTKAELKRFVSRDSGRYGRECWDVKVLVAIETDDGRRYWFFTPAADFGVTTSGPYSVATLRSNDWVTSERWDCEGFAGARGLGQTPVARVKVGDRVEVKGRVKDEGRFGVQLWYVKRLDYSFGAVESAAKERVRKAMKSVPGSLPANVTPPLIPGVEWSRIGGHYDPEYAKELPADAVKSGPGDGRGDRDLGEHHYWIGWDSKVTNTRLLVAHVEGVDPATVNVDPQ